MTDDKDEVAVSPDVHFEPVIRLPEVMVKTLEEDEEEILKLRARLYRYVTSETPPEWKERGTGDVKLLRHTAKGTVRLLMRRDKTLKICANHYITPWMELKPNCGSDRAWVWSVAADFADEEPKEEMLAIKFGNPENAKKFKDVFEECQKKILDELSSENDTDEDDNDDLTKKLDNLTVASETSEEKKNATEEDASESPSKKQTSANESVANETSTATATDDATVSTEGTAAEQPTADPK